MLSLYCRRTATVMPPYCRRTAAVLPPYCRGTAAVLPPYCRRTAAVLPPYCRRTAAVLPPYCRRTATVLPSTRVASSFPSHVWLSQVSIYFKQILQDSKLRISTYHEDVLGNKGPPLKCSIFRRQSL